MFEIQAKSPDAYQLAKFLGVDALKQTRFAGIMAATETGQMVKAAELRAVKTVFDRPTKFTLNSLQLQPATKTNPSAIVRFRDFAAKGTPATKYLGPQAYGGTREHKRFEMALIHKGAMLSSQFAIPTKGAPLDQFGNVKRSEIVKMLSDAKAFGEQGYQANRTGGKRSRRKASGYFIAKTKAGRPIGVWQTKQSAFGEGKKAIFKFVSTAPRYRVRLHFEDIASATVARNYDRVFMQALDQALATAWRT